MEQLRPLFYANKDRINYEFLIKNTSVWAMDIFRDLFEKDASTIPIYMHGLCSNNSHSAIHLLETYVDVEITPNIHWPSLSANPFAMHILENNLENVDWHNLCTNPHPKAIQLLENNPDKICIALLASNSNPAAKHLLNTSSLHTSGPNNRLYWSFLSNNPNPFAIDLLKQHPKRINWELLSRNSGAMELLEANLDKVKWAHLAYNPNSSAIELLKANPSRIYWYGLSTNSFAIELLEANPGSINWDTIWENPGIFEEGSYM